MKKLVLAGLTVTSLSAFADQAPTANILKVASNQQKLILQNNEGVNFKIGDILTVSQNCKLEVIQLARKQALAKTELCEDKSLLKPGVIAQLENSNSIAQVSPEVQTNKTQIGTQATPSKRPMIVNGFIVGLDMASLQSTTTGTNTLVNGAYSQATYPTTTSSSTAFGADVSYGYIPASSIGVLGGVTILENNQAQSYDKFTDFTALRAELNVAVGLPKYFYTYAGINTTKFTDAQYSNLNPNMGWQVGAGAIVFKNFGLDLAYVAQSESTTYDNVATTEYGPGYGLYNLSRTYDIRSIEAKATYTF